MEFQRSAYIIRLGSHLWCVHSSSAGTFNVTVYMCLAPKKQPASPTPTSAPRPSDAPAPSAPQSDAPTLSTISPEGVEPSPGQQEPPTEGEGTQEESSGGAFNPETGEINWDCPCLGGMAHGPCGQQFREAFSCFVYSEADPKGIDCVEKFKAMQDCFREHPDVYGDGMWIYPRDCLTVSLSSQKLWTMKMRNLPSDLRPQKRQKATRSPRTVFHQRRQNSYHPPHHHRIVDIIDASYSRPSTHLLHLLSLLGAQVHHTRMSVGTIIHKGKVSFGIVSR